MNINIKLPKSLIATATAVLLCLFIYWVSGREFVRCDDLSITLIVTTFVACVVYAAFDEKDDPEPAE